MIRFLILAAQRTGSTVIGDALDRHPEVSCEREMFLAGQKRARSYTRYLAASRWRRFRARVTPRKSIDAYLEAFFAAEPPLRAVGMKLMYNQRSAEIDGWIDAEKPHVVHLVRHNLVKVVVSRLTAEARGVYHVERDAPRPAGAVAIRTEKLVSELEKLDTAVDAQRRWLERRTHLEIAYEDLLADPDDLFRRLHHFLGVSPGPTPDLPLRKVNPDVIAASVANYGELQAVLHGTRFAAFLDQDPAPTS